MKKIFFILVFSIVILGFSQSAQASISDGNWWEGCKSATSKAMSFLSDKLGVKLAYAQVCFPPPTSVCSLTSGYHRWFIDEAIGTTLVDFVGDNEGQKNGTAVGTVPVDGVAIIPGNFGNARNFNMAGGTGEYVNFGQFYSIGQGTVSAWIKPSGNNYSSMQAVIAGYDFPSTVGVMLWAKGPAPSCSDQWCVYLPGIGYISSGEAYNSAIFPNTAWTHLAVTYDGAWVRFYRNGSQVRQVAQSATPTIMRTTFSLGRQGSYSDGYFSGGIDSVGLWRLALTGPQVLSLYNTNRSGLKVAKTTFSWPSYADSCGAKRYTLTVSGNGGGTFAGLVGTSFTVNLYPSTAYSWTYSASGSFLSSDGVSCVNTTFYPNISSSFTTPACPVFCYDGKVDIGLRAQEAGATVRYAAEAGGASPLRVFKNGTNYGIILVDPSDANASKARVQTSSGVKAFCKFP